MAILKIDENLRVRLKTACVALKTGGIVSNMTELGEKLGYSNRISVSQILNGTVPVPRVFVERLLEAFPCLSEKYITEGVGAIMVGGEEVSSFTEETSNGENVEHLMAIIKDYQSRLDARDRQIDVLLDIVGKKDAKD